MFLFRSQLFHIVEAQGVDAFTLCQLDRLFRDWFDMNQLLQTRGSIVEQRLAFVFIIADNQRHLGYKNQINKLSKTVLLIVQRDKTVLATSLLP